MATDTLTDPQVPAVPPPCISTRLRLVICPTPGWRALNLRELWRYRELLWFMALRDIQIRYKQTVLGAAWAVIQPLCTMVVFSIFFGQFGGMADRIDAAIPYPLYTFCALMPWQLFAGSLGQATNSIVNNRNLLTKVYYPRLIAPLAPLLSNLVDFAIVFCIFIIMMLCYGVTPGWAVLTLPLFVLFALATSLSIGLWCAALNALYRDVGHVLPFAISMGMFLTPVAYPASIVPERWRALYSLNPMTNVVEGFRWALLGAADPPGPMLLVSLFTVTLVLIGGLFYFRRMEKTFADLV